MYSNFKENFTSVYIIILLLYIVVNYLLLFSSKDINSPVSVDSTTGPHVTITVTFPLQHVNKSCSLIIYGLNTTVQSTINDYTIQYTVTRPLIVGLIHNYKVTCSVVNERDQKQFKFVEMGSFTPGIIERI